MKLSTYTAITIICMLILFSCVKTSIPPGTSSLNVVNTVPGISGLITNFQGSAGSKTSDPLQYYNTALQIYYGNWSELSSYSGTTHLSFSPASDTLTSISNVTLNMQVGGIYSLFLTGTDNLHVDTLFTKDVIPSYPYSGDSLMGVRFVNLSTGSQPVLVTIEADTTHMPIANNISYKTVTGFHQLSANTDAINNGYAFEFRDAVTDSILTTVPFYNYTSPAIHPYKSVTVCLIGQPGVGAAVPLSGRIVPNY